MGERLAGRVAVVIGGGQTPGDTIGNGRATSILFAREGARVVVVDRVLESANATVKMIHDEGGQAVGHAADITDPDSCATIPSAALDRYGALDVLHNNVGIGTGDLPATRVDEEAWQRIFDVNLTGMWRT
jgi:NAD(P)-dependent dehydrogenase (short-subunit alcohol dehydrogenase family)